MNMEKMDKGGPKTLEQKLENETKEKEVFNMLRLEYRTESSQKFWEPKVEGGTLTVRFGKMGIDDQTHTKDFSSSAEALAEYRKLVCEKLAKGYKPTHKTVVELLQNAPPEKIPAAISSFYIGEHVPDGVVQDICDWATACIQHRMTPKQFKSVWQKFMDGEDEELEEALGKFSGKVSPLESSFWLDETEWGEGELDELYAKAVKNGGDRFVWFDNNAYIDIVALRGDPGVQAIEVCVLDEENCKDEKGNWLTNWPDELGPGAPIVSMSCDDAMLRSGKTIKGKSQVRTDLLNSVLRNS